MIKAKRRPKATPMDADLLELVAAQFRALAEPARLAMLQQLHVGEASVNELSEGTGFSQANTSKHLSMLHAAGFLKRTKRGTSVVYSIADPMVHELCNLMCARVSKL